MIDEIIFMNGYGFYVWSAFIFTLLSFTLLYVATKIQFMKEQRKFIAKYGVGLNNIDFEACDKYGVKVGWKPGVNKFSVAEMTVGLILMLSRNLYVTSNQLKDNYWNKNGGWSISGKTLGIVGYGNVGRKVSDIATAFGVVLK